MIQPQDLQLFFKKSPVQVFPCEFCKVLKDLFFKELLRTTASGYFFIYFTVLSPRELIETSLFLFLDMFFHGIQTW